MRAGGERGLSVTVDLAALMSLRFLSNNWTGKRLEECTYELEVVQEC